MTIRRLCCRTKTKRKIFKWYANCFWNLALRLFDSPSSILLIRLFIVFFYVAHKPLISPSRASWKSQTWDYIHMTSYNLEQREVSLGSTRGLRRRNKEGVMVIREGRRQEGEGCFWTWVQVSQRNADTLWTYLKAAWSDGVTQRVRSQPSAFCKFGLCADTPDFW